MIQLIGGFNAFHSEIPKMNIDVQDLISPSLSIKIENYAFNGSGIELRTYRNKRHAKIFSKQGEFGKWSRAVLHVAKNIF